MSFESLGLRFIAKLEDIFLSLVHQGFTDMRTAVNAIYQVLSQYSGCLGARAVTHLKNQAGRQPACTCLLCTETFAGGSKCGT